MGGRRAAGAVEGRCGQLGAKPPLTQGSPGVITLREDAHSFRDGDLVTFSGIEGMVELNGCASRLIRVRGEPAPLQFPAQRPSPRLGQTQPGPWGWVLSLPS